MTMRLSDKEASILLGATLMHWGVPFRFAPKHELTDHQQTLIDEASEKLIALREACRQPQSPESQSIEFSDQEAALLINVVDDCLGECGNDPTELSLQLKTSDQSEVECLVERMRVGIPA